MLEHALSHRAPNRCAERAIVVRSHKKLRRARTEGDVSVCDGASLPNGSLAKSRGVNVECDAPVDITRF